jgi:hypothetical protein
MRLFLTLGLLSLLAVAGCRESADTTFTTVGTKIGSASPTPADTVARNPDEAVKVFAIAEQQPAPKDAKGDQPAEKKEKPRKIRYTAEMRLVVQKLDDAETALEKEVKDAKGDIAKAETTSEANTVRTGTWRIRLPADNLQAFRKAIAKIGDVERNTLDSEDLTAQYYDLEAHIKNRKDARDTLRELLKETGKKDMKAYVDVWDKLEQITDEINRKEGQLKLMANLTELTTVTVHLREKKPYDPARIEDKEIPTFGTRASTTWTRSWEKLVAFCEGAVMVAIALTPWLPVILVVAAGIWFIARRLARASERQPVLATAAPTPAAEQKS